MSEYAMTPAERRAISSKKVALGGYAAPPGTGPKGETCKTCAHIWRRKLAKTYIKCALMKSRWTGGGGTDIKAKAAACSKWEAMVSP